MTRINLIGESRKSKDVAALAALRKLWKADTNGRSVYAEYQWKLLQEGCSVEGGEVHLCAMFADRIVRRRFDKRLRDKLALRYRHTVCYSCGALLLMRRQGGKYVPTGPSNQRLCEACKEECKPIDNGTVGNPVVRIGTRSLKALRSDTYRFERLLRASSTITPSAQTPANVRTWASRRVTRRTVK